jgi:hypothetical protein
MAMIHHAQGELDRSAASSAHSYIRWLASSSANWPASADLGEILEVKLS